MLSKTTIILSVAIALSSASGAVAAERNAKHAFAAHHDVAASARAARAHVQKPPTDFETIWFRAAEGPEWN